MFRFSVSTVRLPTQEQDANIDLLNRRDPRTGIACAARDGFIGATLLRRRKTD